MRSRDADIDTTLVEKRCPVCRVSVPPEYKQCIHCGGKLVNAGGAPPTLQSTAEPAHSGQAPTSLPAPMPTSERSPEPEGGEPEVSPARRGFSALWMLMALGMAVANTCARG